MKFRVRLPQPSDFHVICPREPGLGTIPAIDPQRLPMLYGGHGLTTRTVLLDDRPIALLGTWEYLSGVALAWGTVSRSARPSDLFELADAIRQFLPSLRLRRIEATVRASFPKGERWLRAIGFEREGAMSCYGPNGETHILYAITFPEFVAAGEAAQQEAA